MSGPDKILPLMIGAVSKNATEEIRVALQEFKGLPLCDVRVYGQFSAAALYMPTKRGLTFNIAMLPDLIKVLTEAKAKAQELALVPHDSE